MATLSTSATAASLAHLPTGTLLPSHTSTLSVTYTSFPTPWPILIVSIVISLVLGHIGWKSAFQSWHPAVDMSRMVREPGTDVYVDVEVRKAELRAQRLHMTEMTDYEMVQSRDPRAYQPINDRRI